MAWSGLANVIYCLHLQEPLQAALPNLSPVIAAS
jgi:hypothetical protein